MSKVMLVFPDTISLTEFMLKHKVAKADVNSGHKSLTACLSKDQLATALKEYRATLVKNMRIA